MKRLWPDTKCAIGPAIKDGFYYDFEFSFPFTTEHLADVEKEMKKIVKEALPLERSAVSREEALKLMEDRGEPYKVELIEELPEGEEISLYKQGEFVDLCAGPRRVQHERDQGVQAPERGGRLLAWRRAQPDADRIYGTSFPKAAELDEYLAKIEEAKKRDHRKLGKELGLFAIMEEGPGFPFFLPKGMVLKNLLIDYWRKLHTREGYVEISTPIILSRHLWENSGHWDHYKDNMYTTVIDDEDYAVKPMNCPGGMLVYKVEPRSYKDLPMRVGELGLVHRHEKSGQLHEKEPCRFFLFAGRTKETFEWPICR